MTGTQTKKTFTISADNLNARFAIEHADVLGDPRWSNGDLRRVEAKLFDETARFIWGLEFLDYVDHLDAYKFEIIDEVKFRKCGFASYGTVDKE